MKLPAKSLSLLITLYLLAACAPVPSVKIAKSNEHRIAAPDAPADDVRAVVDGDNAFALDLYQSLRARDGNLVFSPYSISLALAMTYAGAHSETESQMARTLHYTLPQDRLHPAFNQLDLDLTKEGQPASKDEQPLQLDIANAVWAEQTFSFLQGYLDLIARNYGAGIQLADFINQYEAKRRDINQWVSDQTNNKITDLIPQGVLDSSTKMVLVNAIYFKADWQEQFDPADTHDAHFHLLDGSDVQVKMMSNNLSGVPYAAGNGYQVAELVYAGNTAAMDILVPDEGNFTEFESQLNSQKLDEILNGMRPTTLALRLPKFSYKTNFDLGDQLSALGMPDAFDRDRADFSGMTGGRDLFISKVLHQAFVALDEKGTEAAAATAVIMMPTSAMPPGVTLTVDRPFIFIIRDLDSGQILFIGRTLNPTE